ncbi:alpha/beta hydrolase domain-containing protein [Macrolepiota fuliginosa MF-IS2]|uniref:Alpha/beta hydrolase domain-containing protein n=1 Tax=Macrolepiota fuliginosa MF-IS2 TaxID=1400762 RepID=A0A9P5XDX9_9AGAR|nr:alpha/beta hydrolase domain-containing protein [Macrolepiota fuliginosa MF-IS2]
MDTVAKLLKDGVEDIIQILEPTSVAFKEIIQQNITVITDVSRKTFKYGDDERHQLDIYHPPAAQTGKTPILFYVYGGAFVGGARVLPPPLDMAYPCVGAFFARQGFITIIADYRLAGPPMSAVYPQPAEDIRDAILWAVAHPNELASPTTPNPDIDSLFVMGHSAGGAHVGTLLFEPDVLPPESSLRSRIKGIILVAAMYYSHVRSGFKAPAEMYYGDKIETHSVLSLLKSARNSGITGLPKILLVEGEHEPGIVKEQRRTFQSALEAFLQKRVPLIIAEGHNHISAYTALSSGQGEKWAIEASKWMRETS